MRVYDELTTIECPDILECVSCFCVVGQCSESLLIHGAGDIRLMTAAMPVVRHRDAGSILVL